MRGSFIKELQSIRGIAATVVVIHHTLGFFALTEGERWIPRVWNGHAAVVLFFVLSGYVLTAKVSEAASAVDLTRWYVRRLFRIYPALWAASLIAIAYLAFLHWQVPVTNLSEWMLGRFREDRWDVLHVAASVAGVLAFLLPQLWTVTVELVGSAVMPVLAAIAKRGAKPILLTIAVLLVVSVAIGARTYYGIASYIADFAIGVALHQLSPRFMAALRPYRYPLLAVAVACLFGARAGFIGGLHDPRTHMVELVGAVILVSSVIHYQVASTVFSDRRAVWLGDISYSVYLVHFPVMCILAKLVGQAPIGGLERNLVLTVVTLVATLPLSAWLYKYVELPGITAGKRASETIAAPRPAAV
jgi:peptidoglycan/LPS O-acetylase OafA/YrhL